jgi:hypothetical protein
MTSRSDKPQQWRGVEEELAAFADMWSDTKPPEMGADVRALLRRAVAHGVLTAAHQVALGLPLGKEGSALQILSEGIERGEVEA